MATGYGRVMTEERARELGLRPLLYKPFTMVALGAFDTCMPPPR
jgi:hypothetical protein